MTCDPEDCLSDRDDLGLCLGYRTLIYGHQRQIVLDCDATGSRANMAGLSAPEDRKVA